MKLNLIEPKQAAMCGAIGAGGALVYLFAFPAGSISTLMHAVLALPGPGAGIALVLGPFLVLVALVSSRVSQKDGAAFVASLAFSVVYSLVVSILGIKAGGKGAFGSPVFIAAIALFSIAAETMLMLSRNLAAVWRCMLSGALGNVVLLVFYWIAVFPHTYKPVAWRDVPILMGLCIACGLLSGCIAWAVSRPFSRTITLKE